MARPLRIEYAGALYHVTSRGNAGARIFGDDADRAHFLNTLAIVVERFGWCCHGYCLMGNHYHLLIETAQPNLSRGMKHLNGVYTQWLNRRHRRSGHVLQGRFKSVLVEKEGYLLELARYIVLNPVRAKMVRSARDWPWSSYRATAALAPRPGFLTTDWLLSQFDGDPEAAIRAYRQFVRRGKGVDVWDDLTGGSFLGGDAFAESLRPLLRDVRENREIRRNERLALRPTLDKLFESVNDRRSRNERIHAAVRTHQYKLKEVGDHLGLCYSTISVIAKRMDEELRS